MIICGAMVFFNAGSISSAKANAKKKIAETSHMHAGTSTDLIGFINIGSPPSKIKLAFLIINVNSLFQHAGK